MTEGQTSSSMTLFTCVACDLDVRGTVQLTYQMGDIMQDGNVVMTAKVSGISVSHDCIPKAVR